MQMGAIGQARLATVANSLMLTDPITHLHITFAKVSIAAAKTIIVRHTNQMTKAFSIVALCHYAGCCRVYFMPRAAG